MASDKRKVKWKRNPDEHDFPAAASYLSLLVAAPGLRAELVAQLEAAEVVHYKAKDLLRASQLPLLTSDNAHVAIDLKKIHKKQPLSPVLLVRGDLVGGFPLQIADGYHRICASHEVDEDTDIPCRLIDLPRAVTAPAAAPAPARPRARRAAAKTAPAAAPVAAEPVPVAVSEPVVEVAAPVTSASVVAAPVAKKAPVKRAPAKAAAKKVPAARKSPAKKAPAEAPTFTEPTG